MKNIELEHENRTCGSLDLIKYVLSTIVNNREKSFNSTEIIATVNNDPDFLVQTIEHILRSNCMNQIAKELKYPANDVLELMKSPDESINKIMDSINLKMQAK